jgi:hypothetical protein
MFSIDQVGKIEDRVETVLVKERERFSVVYDVIEKYVAQYTEANALAIYMGGSIGIDMLFRRPRTLDDYDYILYSEEAFMHANDLTNEIAKTQDYDKGGFVVMLITKIPYKTYEIQVDGRTMVKFIAIGGKQQTHASQKTNTHNLILPIKEKSYHGHIVLILSPEIYLIDTYHTLTSPQMVGEWATSLRDETKLFQLTKRRLDDGIFSKDRLAAAPPTEGAAETEVTRKLQKTIEQTLLTKVVNKNANLILIGEHALRILNGYEKFIEGDGDFIMSSMVVNIIGNENEIYEAVKKVITALPGCERMPVVKASRNVPILEDFRLKRCVIKAGPEGKQREIMYVYNSTQYDPVPFSIVEPRNPKNVGGAPKHLASKKETDSISLGTPFTLLRFLLIDIWVVRYIHQLGMIDENFAKKRLANLIKHFIGLRTKMQDSKIDIKTMSVTDGDKVRGQSTGEKLLTNLRDDLFGADSPFGVLTKQYQGVYISEMLAIKLELQAGDKKFPPYSPQRAFCESGSYRNLRAPQKHSTKEQEPKEEPKK